MFSHPFILGYIHLQRGYFSKRFAIQKKTISTVNEKPIQDLKQSFLSDKRRTQRGCNTIYFFWFYIFNFLCTPKIGKH